MPYVSKINTSVDGIVPVGSNLYGVCSTGASTASKTVTLSDFDVLITGVTIHVKFTYGNSASSITLTVGSTAGKPVKVSDSDTGGHWSAGSVVSFTYDGASWVQNDYLDTSSKLKYTEDAPDVGIYKNNVVQNDVANNTATGGYALAEGLETRAIGWASHAEGSGTRASGSTSHAEGYNSVASGTGSHAEGFTTLASGGYDHAEGYFTQATNTYAHAEGYYAQASGFASHAEGENTVASGEGSHAQGIYTTASKKAQTVIGTFNEEDTASTTTHPSADADYGQYALIIGNGSNTSNRSNAFTVEWDGDVNIPAGASYKVNGVPIADTDTTYTMSISGDTLTLTPSSGSPQSITLPDDDTTYTLTKSGSTITLTGSDGSTTSVTDDDTILQYVEDAPDVGSATNNVLLNDVANNTATGGYSLAQNLGTKASSANQTAIGKYNIEDTSDTYALIIGNGTADNSRSNAFTVDWSGNVTTPARVYSDALRTRYVSSKNGYHAVIWVDLSSSWNANYPSGMNYDGTLTQSSTDKEWMQSVVKSICAKYPNITNAVFRGQIYPNSKGFFEIFIYDTSALANGYPVCVGTFRKYSTNLYTFSTNGNGAWSWKTNVTSSLTKTYVANSYVTQTAFERMNCYDIGNAYVVHGNLQITAGVPVGQSITIGKFTFPEVNAVAAAFQQTPIGTGSGSLNMTVEANGDVKIYNYGSSATGGGWARFSIVLAHV